jgi:NitT/TauT family transport system permease protein
MNVLASNLGGSIRPDVQYELSEMGHIGDAEKPLSLTERVLKNDGVRRAAVVVLLIVVWELAARWNDNPLLFPSFGETLDAFWNGMRSGVLIDRMMTSLEVLAYGYSLSIIFAILLTIMAVFSSFGATVLTTLVAVFNPLPAIAILPLALMWFGLGTEAIVVVVVQSVVWTIAMNVYAGFQSVPETLRMAGQNMGMRGLHYMFRVLIPAAFPYLLAGLRIGWAHAWRTLIGAELVFGVAARSGGLGWYIYENRATLDTANTFAAILLLILIGFIVETAIFMTIEAKTIRKWGMIR